MKYYSELSKLESELIRLETLSSLVSVITAGFENSTSYKDLQNSMYHIEDALKAANDNIRQEFDELWNVIRDETHDYDDPFDETFEDEYDTNPLDNELSISTDDDIIGQDEKYDFKPVESVMSVWAKS